MFENTRLKARITYQAGVLAPYINTISSHMKKHCAYCSFEVKGDLNVRDFLIHLVEYHQFLLTPEDDDKFHKLIEKLK